MSLMSKLPQPIESDRSGSGWMLIFADTLSLLLAFFVLLFSMSTLRTDTWLSMANGLAQRLNPARYHSETSGPSDQNLPRTNEPAAMNLGYLTPLVQDKIREIPGLAGVTVTPLPDRIIVSIPADRLFASQKSGLTASGANSIFLIGGFLGKIGNKVAVAGYAGQGTDATVLAIDRATAVARDLSDSGYDGVTAALAYADPRGQGYAIDPTAENRDRVDIMILDSVKNGS